MEFLLFLIPLVGRALYIAIVVDALLSWLPYSPAVYKIRGFLQSFTAPLTSPVRKLLSPLTRRIMIDLTPIVAIFLLEIIQYVLVTIILRVMYHG